MDKSSSSGIDLSGALLIMFIGLKLCKQIDWSWWWVFSPVWIPLGFAILFVLMALFTGQVKRYKK